MAAFAEQKRLPDAPPRLASAAQLLDDSFFAGRDLHVRLESAHRTMSATVCAASGDAGMTPADMGSDAATLHALMASCEAYVAEVVDDVEAAQAA